VQVETRDVERQTCRFPVHAHIEFHFAVTI
jgi:hypothetical protein